MVLARKSAIDLLDLIGGGAAFHAQGLIVISKFHVSVSRRLVRAVIINRADEAVNIDHPRAQSSWLDAGRYKCSSELQPPADRPATARPADRPSGQICCG